MKVISRSKLVRGIDGVPSSLVRLCESRGRRRNRWVAFVLVKTAGVRDLEADDGRETTLTTAGWNGSYHDADWRPFTVAFGASPKQARRRLQRVLANCVETKDLCVRRFEARRLVREGD